MKKKPYYFNKLIYNLYLTINILHTIFLLVYFFFLIVSPGGLFDQFLDLYEDYNFIAEFLKPSGRI